MVGSEAPPQPGVVVENRTGGDVDFARRVMNGLRVDERVIRGELAVPISPGLRGPESKTLLVPQQSQFLGDTIVIAALPNNTTIQGGIIRAANGPWFLAVGSGKVFVRSGADGSPFFEAEDPKLVTVVPVERVLPECEAGVLDAPFEVAAPSVSLSEGGHVETVTRDADGCRQIEIVDEADAHLTSVRACIPDAAYPFADGDSVRFQMIGFGAEGMIRFQNARGDRLELGRIDLIERSSSAIAGLEFALDEDPRCVHVEPECGDVDIPVRARVRMSETSVEDVAFGAPIPHADGDTTYFILRAAARPVAAPSCSEEGSLASRARAYIATVYRAPI
jgi:hypothetical protein